MLSVQNLIKRVLDAFVDRSPHRLFPGSRLLWFLFLYICGGLIWALFLNWGEINFGIHDWVQEGSRYGFLRSALLQGKWPLHTEAGVNVIDRFLAIPDTVISPQIFLLRYLQPGPYVLVQLILLYTVGFAGLLLAQRKYEWSLSGFTIAFLLFNFNGHIVAHLAVGHSMWMAYFFLPCFVLLIWDLVQAEQGWNWVLKVALLELAIFLQGGFHFVTWTLFFLALMLLFNPTRWKTIIKAGASSLLLCMPRILPTALAYSGGERNYIGGYRSIMDLVEAMIKLKLPQEISSVRYANLGYWELNLYIGVLGLIFIAMFGVYWFYRQEQTQFWRIIGPVFILVVLSLDKVFLPIMKIPIPLLSAQRVSSRFVILPLVILVMLGVNQFERWKQEQKLGTDKKMLLICLLALIGVDLIQHVRAWRVTSMATTFSAVPINLEPLVVQKADPAYITALIAGTGIALITFMILMLLNRREKKQKGFR